MRQTENPDLIQDSADRTVFDCPVFVQAFLGSSGPAYACLELAEAGIISLIISQAVLAEVTDVLSRPALKKNRRNITRERIEEFLARITQCARFVEDVLAVFSYARDPKDEPYINLAVACGARYLVSRDRDLLDLMED